MKPPKRQVRTISVPSIADKKLNSAAEFRRKIDRDRIPVHPLLVIADLHRGCLKTLAKYLVQESGIPDAKVARALQGLITGSAAETNFQLVVIEHPDRDSARGGRPKKLSSVPTHKQFETVHDLEQLQLQGVPTEAAVAEVAEKRRIGVSTVYNHLQKVNVYREGLEVEENQLQQEKIYAKTMLGRRNAALKSLRAKAKTETE